MTSTTAYAWAPITKVEDQADGTVLVYGPATDNGPDRDRQRLNQQWLDKAMPAWHAEGGNVREQHDPLRAVGVGVGLDRGADGTYNLAARVVDPVAVTKVKAGVLKGFSVGIREPRIEFGKADAPNGEIVGGSIVEVSLVDRPANPRSLFTMVKADAGGELEQVEAPEVVEDELVDDPAEEPEDLDEPEEAPDEPDLGKAATRDQLTQIITDIRTLVPAVLTKADTGSDITDAMNAIASIGRLICSEATTLAAGQLDDADQIACLLDAVRALKYFIACEQAETSVSGPPAAGELADSMSVSGGTYMADKTDTTTVEPAAPDLTKVDNGAVADMVKAAVAEATAPLRDQLDLVKADLAKALEMPVAGGPVGMRTASDTAAARAKDANQLRAQAAELMAKAQETRASDPMLSMGYRERANELLAKADA